MKKLLTAMVAPLLATSAFSIQIGEQVMETKFTDSIQEVIAIAPNGKIFLSDGESYKPKQVHSLVDQLDGIRVGMSVLEELYRDRVQIVTKISENGRYMLEDGKTYSRRNIHHLQNSELGELHLGMEVLEDKKEPSLQTILYIAENNKIVLSDGRAYNKKNIHTLDEELYGIRVGEQVREHDGSFYNKIGENHLRAVVAIANGKFLLDNGELRDPSNVYPLQDEFYGIHVGSCVKETRNIDTTRLVEAISGALFLLNDGKWYHESDLNRNPSPEKCQNLLEKIEAEESPAI